MNLVLTAETEDFDRKPRSNGKRRGFRTTYVPLLKGGNEFVDRVHREGDGFGAGEYYAVVGNSASRGRAVEQCVLIEGSW